MAPKYSEQGGGPATGLASDFVSMLQQGIFGNFGAQQSGARAAGADPYGSTQGIAGVLSDILSGGAGRVGGSMSEMISKQNERDVLGLRARYGASGGMGFGTPGAYAESMYRSEAAPKEAMAIGNLQLQALSQILPLITGLAGKGIAQREGVMTPNPWASAAGVVAPIAAAGLTAATGGATAPLMSATGGGLGAAEQGFMQQPPLQSSLLPGAMTPWQLPQYTPQWGRPY